MLRQAYEAPDGKIEQVRVGIMDLKHPLKRFGDTQPEQRPSQPENETIGHRQREDEITTTRKPVSGSA
jgi:hypothetical protein